GGGGGGGAAAPAAPRAGAPRTRPARRARSETARGWAGSRATTRTDPRPSPGATGGARHAAPRATCPPRHAPPASARAPRPARGRLPGGARARPPGDRSAPRPVAPRSCPAPFVAPEPGAGAVCCLGAEANAERAILEPRAERLQAHERPRQDQVALLTADFHHELVARPEQRDLVPGSERQGQAQDLLVAMLLNAVAVAPQ